MPLLVVLFVVVPLVEIYVIIQVGQAIGPWWTIALLIVDSILGSMLMRSQGRTAWRRFQVALAEGRPPARAGLPAPPPRRPPAGARGARRRLGHLRRRAPADPGLRHRHLRPRAAAAAV